LVKMIVVIPVSMAPSGITFPFTQYKSDHMY
jgi:hypothetical protein